MKLLKRIFFSMQMLHRYHHTLASIVKNTPPLQQLYQISPVTLKKQGVAVLVLDFDGVLAADGASQPVEELHQWLHDCINIFGADNLFVLSNKPLVSRIQYFNQHYAGVRYITGVKKKPYPDGLHKIMALTGQASTSVMLVDDRLLTGVLAACIANVHVTYITKAYVCWSQRPIQEFFFMSLRFLEHHMLRWYGFWGASHRG